MITSELKPVLESMGRECHAIASVPTYALDSYVRHRLRVNFSCRGKKHGGQVQGKLLTVKYGNKFFIKDMKLVTGAYLEALCTNPNTTIDDFLLTIGKRKRTYNANVVRFYNYAHAR